MLRDQIQVWQSSGTPSLRQFEGGCGGGKGGGDGLPIESIRGGQGIGEALMRHMLANIVPQFPSIKKIILNVEEGPHNVEAVGLHREKLGFEWEKPNQIDAPNANYFMHLVVNAQ